MGWISFFRSLRRAAQSFRRRLLVGAVRIGRHELGVRLVGCAPGGSQVTLRDLIARLEAEDPRKVCPLGFYGYRFNGKRQVVLYSLEDALVSMMLVTARAAESLGGKEVEDCFLENGRERPGESIDSARLEEMLASGTVPGEEIGVDYLPDIAGWTFAGNPILARKQSGEEILFDGDRLEIIPRWDGSEFDLPIAVIDRLRAMWREQHGA